MSKSFTLAGLGVVVAVAGAQTAHAQENWFARDRVVGGGDRQHPEFTPQPMRVSTFDVRPNATVSVENNSNVFAADNDEQSDMILRVKPEVFARSNWSRHYVAAQANVDHRQYFDLDDETRTGYFGGLNGGFNVSRDFTLTGKASTHLRHENRGETGAQRGILEPAEIDINTLGAGVEFQRDRIRVQADFEQRDLDYGNLKVAADSTISPNRDFRDHTAKILSGRAAYAITPDLAVFGTVRVTDREYDTIGESGQLLDTEVTNFSAGLSFQTPQLVRGEIAVGYLEEDRADPNLDKQDGVSFDVDLDWLPTQLTKVSLRTKRETQTLSLPSTEEQEVFPSALVTDTTLTVAHELRRNVILFGEVGQRMEEYDEAGPNLGAFDLKYNTIGAGATYKMNRNAHFVVRVDHRQRDHDRPNQDFSQNIISASVKLFP